MCSVTYRRAVEADRPALAAFAAPIQAEPRRHVAYLGTEPDSIAHEMVDEDDDWTTVSAVAERDGAVVGWLMGSVDADMGRVWWFGPFAEAPDDQWADLAEGLYRCARARLPSGVDQEEFGPDARFEALIEWASGAVGAHRDVGSAVLVLDGDGVERLAHHATDAGDPPLVVRTVTDDELAVVGALHDALFPGTHTTGERLVTGADERHVRLAAALGGEVVGYVAVERQPDGAGYIDYLGVSPSRRRRGVGAVLVRAGVRALRDIGCTECSLTVREDNDGARALYRRLGFVEERVIVPLRIGFTLP